MEYQRDPCTTEELQRRGPMSTDTHPLEEAQRTYQQRQEKAKQNFTVKTFGIGFSLHLQHERAATRCPQIGHLGILKRHDAMYNSLTGRDLEFDFSDILAVEPEFNIPTHAHLETLYNQPLFRK